MTIKKQVASFRKPLKIYVDPIYLSKTFVVFPESISVSFTHCIIVSILIVIRDSESLFTV